MKSLLAVALAAVGFQFGRCVPGVAGEGDIGPGCIQDVGVIAVQSGGHLVGNLEPRTEQPAALPRRRQAPAGRPKYCYCRGAGLRMTVAPRTRGRLA